MPVNLFIHSFTDSFIHFVFIQLMNLSINLLIRLLTQTCVSNRMSKLIDEYLYSFIYSFILFAIGLPALFLLCLAKFEEN